MRRLHFVTQCCHLSEHSQPNTTHIFKSTNRSVAWNNAEHPGPKWRSKRHFEHSFNRKGFCDPVKQRSGSTTTEARYLFCCAFRERRDDETRWHDGTRSARFTGCLHLFSTVFLLKSINQALITQSDRPDTVQSDTVTDRYWTACRDFNSPLLFTPLVYLLFFFPPPPPFISSSFLLTR